MKKKNLALFDLDDTLFDGDTEGEWVKYMDQAGLIQDPEFFNEMESFGKSYRQGDLNVDKYSEFLLSPLVGKNLKELEDKIDIFTSDVIDRLTDELTEELLLKHRDDTKILTSGSLTFLVKVIGHKMGIETCFGTDPEYKDNFFTNLIIIIKLKILITFHFIFSFLIILCYID